MNTKKPINKKSKYINNDLLDIIDSVSHSEDNYTEIDDSQNMSNQSFIISSVPHFDLEKKKPEEIKKMNNKIRRIKNKYSDVSDSYIDYKISNESKQHSPFINSNSSHSSTTDKSTTDKSTTDKSTTDKSTTDKSTSNKTTTNTTCSTCNNNGCSTCNNETTVCSTCNNETTMCSTCNNTSTNTGSNSNMDIIQLKKYTDKKIMDLIQQINDLDKEVRYLKGVVFRRK